MIYVPLHFRKYPYAASANIEGVFHQIGVIPNDRPSLRFFWREDLTTEEILTTRFCRVEQSLNARPRVPASADATELDVLTLNYLLLGSAGSSLPSNLSGNFDHRKRYARAQSYSDAIWSRWLRMYVPTLNHRFKWSSSADRDLKTSR